VNLIDDYMKIVTKYTDAPKVFLKASAYHILSTTLGPFFKISASKVDRPNTWFILSSIPGRTRRSTVIEYNSSVILNAYTTYYSRIDSYDSKRSEEKYMNSIIETGTSQGICDKLLHGINNDVHVFNICSHEYGDVLKRICFSSSRIATLLSRLYGGEPFQEDLADGGRTIPSGLYVTMFCGMQRPKMYLNEEMSGQGLLRRMTIIYVKPEDLDMSRWKLPFQDDIDKLDDELKNYSNNLSNMMVEYHHQLGNTRNGMENEKAEKSFLEIELPKKIWSEIGEIARRIDGAIASDSSHFNIYQQNKWETLTKLTVLEALADCAPKNKEKIIVDSHQFRRAQTFMETIQKHTKEMMDELAEQKSNVKESQNVSDMNQVYEKIKRAGPEGIPTTKLLTSTGIKSDVMKGIIKNLIKLGAIRREISVTALGGRPLNMFYATGKSIEIKLKENQQENNNENSSAC